MPSIGSDFARLVSQVDYALYIVTVAYRGERAGCLIGFASQVSISPPRFLACLSVRNRTYRLACRARILVVHAVPREEEELARLFGGETGDEIDKFDRCAWEPGPAETPVLSRLESWFAGHARERVAFGDHAGFLLDPIVVHPGEVEQPLTFRRGRWIAPGHEP